MATPEDQLGGKCPYELLDIPFDLPQDRLTVAYRRRALILHPDKNLDDPEAATKFHALSVAYAILNDPTKRAEYDQKMRARREAELRRQAQDSSRRKMIDDLARREQEAKEMRQSSDRRAAYQHQANRARSDRDKDRRSATPGSGAGFASPTYRASRESGDDDSPMRAASSTSSLFVSESESIAESLAERARATAAMQIDEADRTLRVSWSVGAASLDGAHVSVSSMTQRLLSLFAPAARSVSKVDFESRSAHITFRRVGEANAALKTTPPHGLRLAWSRGVAPAIVARAEGLTATAHSRPTRRPGSDAASAPGSDPASDFSSAERPLFAPRPGFPASVLLQPPAGLTADELFVSADGQTSPGGGPTGEEGPVAALARREASLLARLSAAE
ncbi:hypothetical protein H696_02097 [Fonticula alba]|uniref:J domain-containing protein n=1 Tax=Fonticula alba TaxID=691883 RepID=A0A058ZCI3_FONAL|nr:hypothetical protein H696_02097 [Fonticula alba]KCV71147.1 hypothetical protein H696_02097 [Fonticula alba]|eukprot:XP_009494270.1 hypothetical protein H696_02097 [Fonticula alba]